jgi:hypothetical protein
MPTNRTASRYCHCSVTPHGPPPGTRQRHEDVVIVIVVLGKQVELGDLGEGCGPGAVEVEEVAEVPGRRRCGLPLLRWWQSDKECSRVVGGKDCRRL